MFGMVFKCFKGVFASVLSIFFCMLQLLHMDVTKVDRVLHMGFAWEAAGGAGPLLVRSLANPTC
jgi:hypothetical protein